MPLGRGGRPGLIGMAARTAVVAGTATAVSGNVQRRQQAKYADQQAQQQAAQQQQWEAQQYEAQQYAPPPPPPAAPAAPAGGTDVVAELQKLAALREQGILNDAEFAAAKAKLLG
jgi:transcription initiation factor TFIID subunit TAF12